MSGIRFVGASEIKKFQKYPNVVLVDLRDSRKYRRRRIEGAVSIPYDIFMGTFKDLKKDKIYILYCDEGASSVVAADVLQRHGYKCYSLAGGMHRYCDYIDK